MAAVRTCPTHRRVLVDLGPGQSLAGQDFTAVVRPHLERLHELNEEAVRRPASELERYVLARLDGVTGDAPFLDKLEVHVASRFCEVLGALSIHGRGTALERLNGDDWYLAGAVGVAIAAAGEDGIRAFLIEIQRAYPHGRLVRAGPRSPLSDLRVWLGGNAHDAAYQPLRNVVRRLLEEGPPADIADKSMPLHPPRWIVPPTKAVSEDAKASRKRLRRISVDLSFHRPEASAMNYDQTPIFDAPAQGLTLWDAVDYLNCGMPLFQSLLAQGLVRSNMASGPRTWKHAFARNHLDAFLSRLLSGAERVKEVGADMVGVDVAAAEACCTQVEIIHLLLRRALSWVGRDIEIDGIAGLLVHAGEVGSMTREQTFEGPTLPEAQAELHLKSGAIPVLIEMGLLGTTEVIDALGGASVRVITQSSFVAFTEAHIDSEEISRTMKRCAVNAEECLKRAGVEPLCQVKEPRTNFYPRSVVEGYRYRLDTRSLRSWPRKFGYQVIMGEFYRDGMDVP